MNVYGEEARCVCVCVCYIYTNSKITFTSQVKYDLKLRFFGYLTNLSSEVSLNIIHNTVK